MSETVKTAASKQELPHVGLCVVGHVDAGKSTTTGHLLFQLGGIPVREMEKMRKLAEEMGKGSFTYAFFLDTSTQERERGITINCATKEFFTPTKHYTIIDAPGHKDFVGNMISGSSQADVALLLVPAERGGFETAIAREDRSIGTVEGQTRQHAGLCKLLGIEQIIVGINKMDETPDKPWSQERYNEIVDEMKRMLVAAGYKTERIPFIPISGYNGDNLTTVSVNMPWYKGFDVQTAPKERTTGHTLLDALDKVARIPKRDEKSSFRLPVSSTCKKQGAGDIVCGRVEQGILHAGDSVRFAPSGIRGVAFSIEMHHVNRPEAFPGDNVGVCIKGIDKDKKIPKTGEIMFIEGQPNPPAVVTSFRATVQVQHHPGELKASGADGHGGFTPQIRSRTAKTPARMNKLFSRTGKDTGGLAVENPPYIKEGDQADVEFVPLMPITLEPFTTCPGLGRIAIMDSHAPVMIGRVTSVETKPLPE